MDQIYTPKQDYKVLVRCFTYNQSKYIEDALNGFAFQQTDFPFVCLVVDDCSTDGEQEVIKAWMERECDIKKTEYVEIELSNVILAPHKSNVNCTFAFFFLKQNLYKDKSTKMGMVKPWRDHCEYEALCEGDDYWMHPEKLQKQVDYMDEHPDYVLCATDATIKTDKGDLNWTRYSQDVDVPVKDMIMGGGGFVQTATILYRYKTLMANYPQYCRDCYVGDYPLQIWAALNGKVRYISMKMATYRFTSQGSWTSKLSTTSNEKKIKNWRTTVNMLMGLDEYSKGHYHYYFEKKIKAVVIGRCYISRQIAKMLLTEFQDVLNDFTWKERFQMRLLQSPLNCILRFKASVAVRLVGKK